jgi:putative ABC transport system substrate-binding protein
MTDARRVGRVALVLAVVGAASVAAAQPSPSKVYRVGILTAASSPSVPAFREGLRDLGYVDGRSVTFEHRSAEGRLDRLPALAAELVRLNVDAIFAPGATAAPRAAAQATTTIPIVFAGVADPVTSGFAVSLTRPGRNLTGLSASTVELSGKRLSLLAEAVPGLTRVGVLFDAVDLTAHPILLQMSKAAPSLGITLQIIGVKSQRDLHDAFVAFGRERAGALIVLPGVLFFQRAWIADLAAKNRLPMMADSRPYAEAGSLLAYGPSDEELARRAAAHVDKILKGARPGDLPIEPPTRFELTVNLKTAKTLGLALPRALLVLADQVFE